MSAPEIDYATFNTFEEARDAYRRNVQEWSSEEWLWYPTFESALYEIKRLIRPRTIASFFDTFVRWYEATRHCAWRQELHRDLALLVTGVVPDGREVPASVMLYAVILERCDLIVAFIPRLARLRPVEYEEIIREIRGPALEPVLAALLDIQPLTPNCVSRLTQEWMLPKTILKLLELPHRDIVVGARKEAYSFLEEHGVSFNQPDFLFALVHNRWTADYARIRFLVKRTEIGPRILESARRSELILTCFTGVQETAALRPALQRDLALCEDKRAFAALIQVGDVYLLPYGALAVYVEVTLDERRFLADGLDITDARKEARSRLWDFGKAAYTRWYAGTPSVYSDNWKHLGFLIQSRAISR